MKKGKMFGRQRLHKLTRMLWSIARFFLIFGLSFVILFPLLQILSKAFMPIGQFLDTSVVWIPKSLTLNNVRSAMSFMEYGSGIWNSLVLCIGCAALQIFTCAMTGYGFARFRFRLREPLFLLVLLTIVIPTQIIFLPTYVQYRFFDFFGISRILGMVTGQDYTVFAKNLIDTRWTFWIPTFFGVGIRSGVFIYLFRQCFRNLPKELEESAKIDGCNPVMTYIKVMLPNAKSTILTVFLFSFVWHWNEYILVRTYLPQNYQPLALKLKLATELMHGNAVVRINVPAQMGITYAGALMFILPVLAIYIVAQKWFVEGVESSGIKG